MTKAELLKSIEARKLNRRSGLPLKEPPVMIPYAAVLDGIERDRDLAKFDYLGERYVCQYSDLEDASDGTDESAAATTEAVADSASPVELPDHSGVSLTWEGLVSSHYSPRRAKVPGGWLIATDAGGLCFYPDPVHQWNGGSKA